MLRDKRTSVKPASFAPSTFSCAGAASRRAESPRAQRHTAARRSWVWVESRRGERATTEGSGLLLKLLLLSWRGAQTKSRDKREKRNRKNPTIPRRRPFRLDPSRFRQFKLPSNLKYRQQAARRNPGEDNGRLKRKRVKIPTDL